MEYLITIIASVVSAMLVFILQSVIKENARLKHQKEDEELAKENALKDGVKCLLRFRLMELHSKYTAKDYITIHGLENWIEMYKAYKSLNGNGMVEGMKDEIEQLTIKN